MRGAWLATQKINIPFVKNWDVLLAGPNYPDIPNVEAYMPNMQESWDRIGTFGNLISSTKGVSLASRENLLEAELTNIFNKQGMTINNLQFEGFHPARHPTAKECAGGLGVILLQSINKTNSPLCAIAYLNP